MGSPENILDAAIDILGDVGGGDLLGRHIVVTAGPTVEDLDPVRFLTNRSSGKMGYAIARRARARGATVDLITGPTTLVPPSGVRLTPVRSALEMYDAAMVAFDSADAAIMAAAVSDYRASTVSAQKLRRGDGEGLRVELTENPDIAAALGAKKGARVVVAFAMETEDGLARARQKRVRKNADLIVLNNLTEAGAGFATDTNVVTLIDAQTETPLPLMSKMAVADRILDAVGDCFSQPPSR
jgi:phosphopantothenoylcysteine decarboxylase/phosphopantothenate--cysteine ligase